MTATALTAEQIARRYPWTQYKGPDHQCHVQFDPAARTAWHEARPFRVCWVVPDQSPGLYGWRSHVALFQTEAQARAAAEASMGIAKSVTVDTSNNGWKGGQPGAKLTQLYTRRNPHYRGR